MKSVLKIAIPSVCLSILALGAPEDQFSYTNKTPLHQMSVDHEPSTQMMQSNQDQRRYNFQPTLKDQDQRSQAKSSNLAKIDQDENPGQIAFGRSGRAQAKKNNREQMYGKASELKEDGKDDTKKVANEKNEQDEKKDQEKNQVSAQKVKEEKGTDNKDQTDAQNAKGKKDDTEKMSKSRNESEKQNVKKANNFISSALRADKTTKKNDKDANKRVVKQEEHVDNKMSAPQDGSSVNKFSHSSIASVNGTASTQRKANGKSMKQDGNQTSMTYNASNESIGTSDMLDANKSALDSPKVDNSSVNNTQPKKSNDIHVSVSTSTNVSTTSEVSASADKTRRLADEKPALHNQKSSQGMKAFRGSVSENNYERQGNKGKLDQKQEKKQGNDMKMEKGQAQSETGQKDEKEANSHSQAESRKDQRDEKQNNKQNMRSSNVQTQNIKEGKEMDSKVDMKEANFGNGQLKKQAQSASNKNKENESTSSPVNKRMANYKASSNRTQQEGRKQFRASPRK